MSKPLIHAQSSVRRFGGCVEDYLSIHEKMDSSKIAHAEVSHRCVFHSAFGIYVIEDIFGRVLTNSDGRDVCVRDVAEQHVLEDLGFIPSLSDWLHEMEIQPWMAGEVNAFREGRKNLLSKLPVSLAQQDAVAIDALRGNPVNDQSAKDLDNVKMAE